MLSINGWINGLTATGILVFFFIFGIFMFIIYRKTRVKLLLYLGIVSFLLGLDYVTLLLDFITILVSGSNLVLPYGLSAKLVFIWFAPMGVINMYIFVELIVPKLKSIIITLYAILGVFSEISCIFGDFTIIYPAVQGESLIEPNLIVGSPYFIITIIFILSIIFFGGVGFIYKAITSKNTLRKKYVFLAICTFMFSFFFPLDGLTPPGILSIIFRGGIILGAIFWYLGLRKEPEKPKVTPTEKDIKIKDSIFRFTERPAHITEEEITFHKEKKICLVCKVKAQKITYICPKCEAMYCINCANALTNLENACWVCNTPFDDSKPSKPYDQIEITEKKA
jgi:hypothetical protein